MKQLAFLLFAAVLFASCSKSDMTIKQDAVIDLRLSSIEANQYRFRVDSVQFRFNHKYSKAYRPKEDSLNRAKQGNDLIIVEDNQMLTVDALPIAEDSIPLALHNLVSLEYEFEFTFRQRFNEVDVYLLEKKYLDRLGITYYLEYTLMTPNNPKKAFSNFRGIPPSDRFSVVIRRKERQIQIP